MKTFWDLMQESVIVQGTITLMIISADVYLIVTAQPVPEFLSSLTTLVVGFYFGSKLALRKSQFKG